jgi:predicted DNA-binding transcriptional regulator YafY
MRADRLLALMLLLQSRGRMTATELADRLEVSVRTIYRDIDALSAAGVPVYTEAGTGGGCELLDGYRSPMHGLTTDEAAALLVLGVPEPLREIGLGGAAAGAQRHVRAAAGLHPAPSSPLVHLDMPRWFESRDPVPHLATLATAVRRTQRATITYRRGDVARRRTVDPLGLVNKAGVWYLVAIGARRRTTVFRVGRIASAVVLEVSFERPTDFDLVDYWEGWSAEFEAGLPRLDVTVRASPDAVAVLPEIFGDAVRPALAGAGPPDHEGWRSLTLSFEHERAAAFRLAGFGDLITVVSPTAVRDLLIAKAQGTLRRHRAAT